MNGNIVPYHAIVVYGYVGVDKAVIANNYIVPYKTIGLNYSIPANFGRAGNVFLGLDKRFEKKGEEVKIPERIIRDQ
jgi:hypothetical protein